MIVIGERHGKLIPIEKLNKANKSDFWYLCKCDCGNTLIERDAVLARINCCLGNSLGGRKEFDSGLMQARKFVISTPAVNRWIPVEDALPEIGYSVWVTRITNSGFKYMRLATYQGDCWMDNSDKYGNPNPDTVMAWMPMPDAYKPPEKE